MGIKSHLVVTMTIVHFLLPSLCLGAQPSVAIISIKTSETHYQGLAEEAADAVSSALINRGISVIERQKIDSIISELELNESGLIDDSTMIKAGKLVSVKYVIFGNLAGTSLLNQMQSSFFISGWVQTAQTTLSLKAINVETGEVVFSARDTGRKQKEVRSAIAPVYDKSMLTDAVEQAANNIADKFLSKLR